MRHPHGLRAAAGTGRISFINSAQTQTNGSTADITINKPTNTAQNDLMVAIIGMTTAATRTWTSPAGWTEVLDSTGFMVSYKVAGASEGASYTFSQSGPSTRASSGIIVTYRGAAYDTVGTASLTIASNVQTASGITLALPNSILLAFFASADQVSITWSSPTSGLVSLATDSDASAPSWALYSQSGVSSGSTGNKSATASAGNTTPVCFLVGIKPS